MAEEQQCIFCKIANGEIPSYEIYSDDKCLAFLDINPATKGHTLLIPKEHFSLMPMMPDDVVAHMGQVAKHIAMKAMDVFGAIGVNIFVANGAVAGQNAPHVIVHIIPRYENDGLNLKLIKQKINPNELQKIREMVLPKVEAEFGIKIERKKEVPKNNNEGKSNQAEKEVIKNNPKSDVKSSNETKDSKPDLDAISNILMKNG